MSTISRKIKIDAPVEAVWKIVAKFGDIYEFNPSVPQSYSTSELKQGVGATRHCDLSVSGSSIEERVTDWVENERYQVEIYDGKKLPPFEHSTGGFELTADGDGTIVEFKISYTLKMGIIGKIMDALMVRSQFTKTAEGVVSGLKHYCETGERVDSTTHLGYQVAAI